MMRHCEALADKARDIIQGRNIALVSANAEYLIREITTALQEAFDLGAAARPSEDHVRRTLAKFQPCQGDDGPCIIDCHCERMARAVIALLPTKREDDAR